MSEGARRIKLRYQGTCRVCESVVPAKEFAMHDREARAVTCLDCWSTESSMVEDVDVPAGPPGSDALRADEAAEPTPRGEPEPVAEPAVRQEVDTQPAGRQEVVTEPATLPFAVGDPGASAQAEFQRRHVKREERIRTRHPRLGGLIMALSDDPQSTRAWAVGADGEQRIGRALNGRSGPRLRVIHDARIPGSRANVDHIAVTPSGVYVIDAKKYQGAPDVRFTGPFMTGQKQL